MNKNILEPYTDFEQWKGEEHISIEFNGTYFIVNCLDGPTIIFPGDWIIGPGEAGEYWVVPEDIFQNKYSFY
jgi:hypothetical protein